MQIKKNKPRNHAMKFSKIFKMINKLNLNLNNLI